MSGERFTEGELFVYVNGDRWELGMVKRPNNTGDGYFCWYSMGDTAANTPVDHMHKLANHGFTKMEGLLRAATNVTDATGGRQGDAGTCKLDDFADVPFSVDYEIEGYDMDSGRDYATLAECSACGAYIIVPPEYHHVLTCDGDEVYQPYRFCPNCGRRAVDA